MKVTITGTGYVGLVTGACWVEMGNHVVCLDVDQAKITGLQQGRMPIYEPGLKEIVLRIAEAGRLQFTTDVAHAANHGTLQFIAVGTPPDEDGSADLQYVLAAARSIGRHMTDHTGMLVQKVVARYGENLAGKTFALWGLAFKPNTDDLREAPSRVVIVELTRRGARIKAYDPVARAEAERLMPASAQLSYAANANAALEGADALIIVTEWKEFRTPDFETFKSSLRDALIFDGRNLYEPDLINAFSLEYHAIGRPAASLATDPARAV